VVWAPGLRVEYSGKGADVSQPDNDKAPDAQERSQETKSFVRTVKAATRRKYTPEEKIRVVLEGLRREVTVNDLCRREGIKRSYDAGRRCRLERSNGEDATTGFSGSSPHLHPSPDLSALKVSHYCWLLTMP
jgi:transposase-like protein